MVVLETTRLVLDAIVPSDVDAMYALFSSARVVEYYDLPVFTEPTQAVDLIEKLRMRSEAGLGARWAIRMKSSPLMIGTCGFNSWSGPMRNAVIGYDLHDSYWGRGIVTEALGCILEHAFAARLPCGSLHRIQADTVPGNIRSERVLTRLGFKKEGLRRDAGFWKGRFHDLHCFGLLESEFEPCRG